MDKILSKRGDSISRLFYYYFLLILLMPHSKTPTPIKKTPKPIGLNHQNTTNKSSILKFSLQKLYFYLFESSPYLSIDFVNITYEIIFLYKNYSSRCVANLILFFPLFLTIYMSLSTVFRTLSAEVLGAVVVRTPTLNVTGHL